ncbi:hypothetical protein DPEC_G00161670 [Dallia pectoralis]|uniref:Uncharacterized protein n=1 Tax=Dallia pectoralis TaxID=75939 RepID=A0ACC2GGG4_DALPE|nr:hypothetical protein DPEC_G00161670 [Dallia pectoralis]
MASTLRETLHVLEAPDIIVIRAGAPGWEVGKETIKSTEAQTAAHGHGCNTSHYSGRKGPISTPEEEFLLKAFCDNEEIKTLSSNPHLQGRL